VREIKQFGQFKRDLARESRGRHRVSLEATLLPIIEALSKDEPLEPRHRDHALTGSLKDYRDCHIKPDLVLIYGKPDPDTLQLVRLGSHAELDL